MLIYKLANLRLKDLPTRKRSRVFIRVFTLAGVFPGAALRFASFVLHLAALADTVHLTLLEWVLNKVISTQEYGVYKERLVSFNPQLPLTSEFWKMAPSVSQLAQSAETPSLTVSQAKATIQTVSSTTIGVPTFSIDALPVCLFMVFRFSLTATRV